MSLSTVPDDTISFWRSAVSNDVSSLTIRLRRELDFPYYGSRPIEWVREARDAADTVVGAEQGDNWAEFCGRVIKKLEEWRERWRKSEIADPDGFGAVTFGRFIDSLQTVADCDFPEASLRLDAAARERENTPICAPGAVVRHCGS